LFSGEFAGCSLAKQTRERRRELGRGRRKEESVEAALLSCMHSPKKVEKREKMEPKESGWEVVVFLYPAFGEQDDGRKEKNQTTEKRRREGLQCRTYAKKKPQCHTASSVQGSSQLGLLGVG